MAATLIQPIKNIDDNQVLTLLEGGSSSSIRENSSNTSSDSQLMTQTPSDENHQAILNYLKPSPVSSCNSKKVPRLGPFLLLKTLGVGEFGKVKLGRHIETGQIVAVKLVKKQNIDSSSQLDKIRMEIDILKTLNHPYVVKLLSVNETSANIGMVLEYAQGGELYEYIFKQRYLKEQEACRLFSQLISSVHYMHRKNIVHRDLKLENILLDCHGNLIVTDFGFANQFSPRTGDLMSTSCGSPVYAAPELVMTGRLYAGTGVDIWSCGIILYAMLCGYLPFDDDDKNPNGDNIGRLYRYIMAHKPKYPSYLSNDAKDIIGNMLIPDPKERCNIQFIMSHPWLQNYKEHISKTVQELEEEAQIKKQMLLTGIQSSTNLSILTAAEQYDSNEEEDCCKNSDHDSCSTSSSVSSSYSYSNTKDAQSDEPTSHAMEHANSPSTPSPLQVNNDNASMVASCSEKITPERDQQVPTTANSLDNVVVTPVNANGTTDNTIKELGPTQLHAKHYKRHTIDAAVTGALMQQQKTLPAAAAQQHLSFRAKLFSSVKRRTNTTNSSTHMPNSEKPANKNRHSWQHLMQSHSTKAQPTTVPHPPLLAVEQSKSERLISWLKNTKSLQHKKPKPVATVGSHHHDTYSSSREAAIPEEVVTIPVARPDASSLAPMRSASTTASRTPTLLSPPNELDRLSIASELRVHTGNMNHSALTSKPPMEVLLEVNKILLILGIEVENMGGYKLRCTRRSIHSTIDKTTTTTTTATTNQKGNEIKDVLNHLATNNGTATMITQPIYGHPSIDRGEQVQFLVEICRFQNLSGLFSVDIQNSTATRLHDDNFASYQYIGQKLLSLLQHGNIIRNTNFNLMLRKDVDNDTN